MKVQFDVRRLPPVQRVMLVCGAAVLGSLAFIAYFFVGSGNYEASAVLKLDVSIAEFRRLSTVAFSEEAFGEWAARQPSPDPNAVAALRWVFASSSRTQQRVSPYFRVTRRDLRDVPNRERELREVVEEAVKGAQGGSGKLLGIQLEFEGRTAKDAVETVALVARYLRDVALWDATGEFVRTNALRSVGDVQRLQNELLLKKFDAEQLSQKVADLQRLSARYPASNRIGERQVMLLAGEGKASLYLSPLAQIVGAESELLELRRTVAHAERELERAKVAAAFFERALGIVSSFSSGVAVLHELETLRDRVAAEFRAQASDAVNEQLNQIGATLAEYRVLYVEQPPFLSGHHIATFRVLTLPKAAAIGAVLGAVIGLAVLFVPAVMAWLRNNPQTTSA